MRALRVVVILVGLCGLVAVVPVVDRSPEGTFGGSDSRLLVLEAGAALALLAVAGLTPPRPAAVLIAIVGAAWLVPELAGGVGVPLLARTISDAVAPVLAALLVAAIVVSSGRMDPAPKRPVLLAVGGAALAAASRLLLVDPFDQVDCWPTCDHNPLLLGDGTAGGAVHLVGLLGLVAGALWAAGDRVVGGRRRGPSSAAVDAADVAGWLVVLALTTSLMWPAPTTSGPALAVAVTVQLAVVAWLAAVCREAWLRWRLQSRLARWLRLLDHRAEGETLADSLRAAARDPGLRLAYWAPAQQAYVDADGRPTTSSPPGRGDRVTIVTRRGQTVARMVHTRRVDGARLERALGPALRLALENEQLRAASLAELAELTRSRARVVERAALERRQLERNLHDGAQQRAVSLALLVRLLPARSPAEEALRSRAEALTRTLTDELRRVARGIYPAVLTDAGLRGAVLDLAETSTDLPVVVEELTEARYPGTTESTAYLVICAAIDSGRDRSATCATVSARRLDGALRISVLDDALLAPDGIARELADQVSALGGVLVVTDAPGQHRVEVVLPCAS